MGNDCEKIIKENEILKKENQYLKGLLKENNITFKDIILTENETLTKDEKIRIYKSYFKGRHDIFALKYFDQKTGKKKYFPVCANSFTNLCDKETYKACKGCPNKQYYGLKTEDLLKHFKGEKSYGIYPMLDNDECYFLAVDFDDGDFFNSALEFKKNCSNYGIDCAIEISQSGNGAHVWIFFENSIKAKTARQIADFILNKTFETRGNLTYKSFDRYFPSQDYLEKDGYGNLIALPLDGSLISKGCTIFVDDFKNPHFNQISYLKSVRKLLKEEINGILEKMKCECDLDILPKNILKHMTLTANDFKEKLNIIYNNDLQISKDVLSIKGLKYMMRLGSIPNRDFYLKQRARQSTYNIPRVLQLFKEDDRFIYIPRGCLDDLVLILNYLHVEYDLIDKRSDGTTINVKFIGELRYEQETAMIHLLSFENGVFVAPTAFGKTVLSAALIERISRSTLILVNNTNLIHQWMQKLNEYLQIDDVIDSKNKIGVYYGAKKKLTYVIDVASIHSFNESEECNKILSNYGLILIDEVHHLAARTFERVLRNTNTKYIYGLTATPKRSDGNEKIIFKTIGNIIYEHKNFINTLAKVLIPKITHFNLSKKDGLLSYSEQCNKLALNKERNELILEDIKENLNLKRNIIVLSDRIEHINLLKDQISNFTENVFLIHGQLKQSERKKIMERINNIHCDGFVVISTGKYIGEGFDLPSLNTLFLTMPFKWEGMLSQYVGRLHRIYDKKNDVKVYDYVDIKVPMFSKMFTKRLQAYQKLNYTLLDDYFNYENKLYNKYNFKIKMMEDISYAKKEIILIINEYDYIILREIINHSMVKIKIHSNCDINDVNIDGIKTSMTFLNILFNAVIIDNRIIWYGGINPFIASNYDETIMRIDDEMYAKELLMEIK